MSDLALLWIIQIAPLAAFLLIQLLPVPARRIAPAVGMLGALAAATASLILFTSHLDGSGLPKQYIYPWLHVSDRALWPFVSVTNYQLSVGFLVDKLNLLMIVIVTSIAFFVQLFSYYYMAEDKSRARYFGFLSFFAFSMTGLVLSSNLLQTFLFWELVGLTSYLLIGFWYEKNSAGTAARKAFVINRLADLGFYLGIILLFLLTGTLDFVGLNVNGSLQGLPAGTITILGILVFTGVMGKSAQFPFHNWLPDAMEGPTPVSALIHSATMVAAGVFLLSRSAGLFAASETTLAVILSIGAMTAFVGASLATIQRDIKKILAYSTISQLGLMVMAVGVTSTVSSMFHLATHAYFKSLLFLTSGAFIHHFHSNDIWEIAKRGGKMDIVAMAALFIGLFSLSGLFPFAGFFSKDMILEALRERNIFFYGVALVVSFLTAYYSFRLLFVLLFSKLESTSSHGHSREPKAHAHAPGVSIELCRFVPLASLAIISVYVGLQGTGLFKYSILHWLGGKDAHLNPEILWTTTALILTAAGLAWVLFKNPEAAEKRLKAARGPVKILLDRKFFIDDVYEFLTRRVGMGIANLFHSFDQAFVKGVMVNGTSYRILDLGKWASRAQNGSLQDYLSWALVVSVVVLFWFARGFSGV